MAERIEAESIRKTKPRAPVKTPYYPDVILPRACLWCQIEFIPIRDTARFCCRPCITGFHNHRIAQNKLKAARLKAKQRPIMSAADIGFLAGIIDGEGWMGLSGDRAHGRNGSVRIKVGMTDKDVIETLKDITGTGTVCARNKEKLGVVSKQGVVATKQMWEWSISHRRDTARILCAIVSTGRMSERRCQRIMEMAEILSNQISR